ncbi:hypothetical protein C8Q74DRAFT_97946 [Fomes fomentarius]|nr:hypothetical protein C8Q74DRAFT_97946 [Fomes fomentarius]
MSMSTGSLQAAWEEFSAILGQSVILQALSLLLYEYATTLDLEIDYAWGRRLTWARVMFFLNRCITLLQLLTSLGSAFLTPSNFVLSCIYLPRINQTCVIILYVVWAIFSGLRVYTITGRNKTITTLVLSVGLVPAVTSLTLDVLIRSYTATTDSIAYMGLPEISFCSIATNVTYRDRDIVGILTRIALILSEGIVIVATIKHNCATDRGKRHPQLFTQSYASLFLREGVLFFFAQCVGLVPGVWAGNVALAVTASYLNLLPSILITRFYFTLHTHERRVQSVQSAIQQKVTSRWKPLPRTPDCEDEDPERNVSYIQEVVGYTEKRAVGA